MSEFLIAADGQHHENKCPVQDCPRFFSTRKELCIHVDIHKLHVCEYCEDIKPFQTREGYDRHRQKNHKPDIGLIDLVTLDSDDEFIPPQVSNEQVSREPTFIKVEKPNVIPNVGDNQNVEVEEEESNSGAVEKQNKQIRDSDEQVIQGDGRRKGWKCEKCGQKFRGSSTPLSHQKFCLGSKSQDEDDNLSEVSVGTVKARTGSSSNNNDNILSSKNNDARPTSNLNSNRKRSHGSEDNKKKTSNKRSRDEDKVVSTNTTPVKPPHSTVDRHSPPRSEPNNNRPVQRSSPRKQVKRKVAKVQPAQRQTDTELEDDGVDRKCQECGRKDFSTDKDLATHLLSHNKEKCKGGSETQTNISNSLAHKCPLCQDTFVVKADLCLHIKTHKEGKYPCPDECGEIFDRPFDLYIHIRWHEENSDPPQPETAAPAPNTRNYQRTEEWILSIEKFRHLFTHPNSPENDVISNPNSSVTGRKKKQKHSVAEEDRTVGCREEGCTATFPNVHVLKEHRVSEHPNSTIIHCDYPECDIPFNSQKKIKEHKKKAHGIE